MMVVRGVPDRLMRDGWWLDAAEPPSGVRAVLVLLPGLVLVDLLLWGHRPGLGLVFALIGVAGCVCLTVWHQLSRKRILIAAAILALGLLPMVEVVQFGTTVVALFALSGSGLILAGVRWDDAALLRALRRLPLRGVIQTAQDAFAIRVKTPTRDGVAGLAADWMLPAVVGGVFIVLFAAANPVVDGWIANLINPDLAWLPSTARVLFWVFLALMLWPLLRLPTMLPALTRVRPRRMGPWRSGFVNARSVARALILFNLIFLFQTVLDLGYLWGGHALPDGMSYAEYAHRGAYPLLATALMAGAFALMAQPHLGEGRALRVMLYLWVAQTVLLVLSSILRLDLYVDVYGLTRLRVAAFVWMVVVALGLVLIVMQMRGRKGTGWFLQRAAALGLLAVYLCNLWNIDGLIARHNLATDRQDHFYLCGLSEGAVPAIRAHELRTGTEICYSYRPYLYRPTDWREWGYRNARLRHSLAAMEPTE
ncbi:MAG: DUF4173 domain-containing protein [Pseudomonadota bacterium]